MNVYPRTLAHYSMHPQFLCTRLCPLENSLEDLVFTTMQWTSLPFRLKGLYYRD
jgi:hypothetical protein